MLSCQPCLQGAAAVALPVWQWQLWLPNQTQMLLLLFIQFHLAKVLSWGEAHRQCHGTNNLTQAANPFNYVQRRGTVESVKRQKYGKQFPFILAPKPTPTI